MSYGSLRWVRIVIGLQQKRLLVLAAWIVGPHLALIKAHTAPLLSQVITDEEGQLNRLTSLGGTAPLLPAASFSSVRNTWQQGSAAQLFMAKGGASNGGAGAGAEGGTKLLMVMEFVVSLHAEKQPSHAAQHMKITHPYLGPC